MSSVAVHHHHHSSGAGPLSLMSCVGRESSPQPENEREPEKTTSKKKFWNPKRWFKRKQSHDDVTVAPDVPKDAIRSRSTSELSDVEDDVRRRSTSSMHPTLSLSHDSVFQSPHSGSSEMELDNAQSSSSLSISQPYDQKLKTELCERLRLRRGRGDTSEDDEGLPRSPCNSPTAHDGHSNKKTASKDLPTKSHSTCSDGSLLSMDSSEIEEESFGLSIQSRQSSKISFTEKKYSYEVDNGIEDLDGGKGSIPLNHSAAHHKVSVRPRKTHGAPRRQKKPTSALPATPEVNEDSNRIPTPDIDYIDSKVTDLSYKITLTETQMKCSSLPPGLVGPNDPKISRSKSNAGIQKEEHFMEHKEEKSDKSFFSKIIRSSGKKRRSKEKHQEHLQYTTSQQKSVTSTTSSTSSTSVTRIESKPITAPRNSAVQSRQRVLPRNLPASPQEERKTIQPAEIKNLSPIQLELENRIKQRQSLQSPPLSPKPPRSPPVIVKTEVTRRIASRHSEINSFEEIKPKIELGNVSAFHSKIISFNASEETDNSFKSLSNFAEKEKIVKPVTKSQSFKAPKDEVTAGKVTMSKAASTDSVQVQDESNFKIDIKPTENNQEIVKEVTNKIVNEINDDFPTKIIKDHGITISGPSHTAVVNVTSSNMDSFTTSSSNTEVIEKDLSKTINIKESQVSVTKIQLKHETTTTTVTKPEFIGKQLNKVELKSPTNVIFSMKSPKIIEEQSRPKTLNFDSDVNMEIIEKSSPEEDGKPPLSFKFKKKVLTPETPKKSLSVSLDEDNRSSSQDSLDLLSDSSETVVMRRKSMAKKKDDEPELMKVFARRSMKIRDSDSESLSQELEEKEVIEEKKVEEKNSINKIEEARRSLEEDRRKSEEKVKIFGLERRKSEEKRKSDSKENIPKSPKNEEPKIVEATEKTFKEVIIESTADIQLRKSPIIKNQLNNFPRSVSLSYNNAENNFKKPSFAERRVTTNFWSKNEESEEIISKISRKEEQLNDEKPAVEPKNFNQRKAEWEKRAQLAQKNTVP